MADAVPVIAAVLAVMLAVPGALLVWSHLRERRRAPSSRRGSHARLGVGIGMLLSVPVFATVFALSAAPGSDGNGNGHTDSPTAPAADPGTVRPGGGGWWGEVGAPMEGHTGNVGAVVVAELDNRQVVISGSIDETIRVWDLATRRQLGQPIVAEKEVGQLAVAQVAGRTVVVADSGTTSNGGDIVQVWDLETRDQLHELDPQPTGAGVTSLAIAERGGRPVVVVGRDSGQVQIGDLESGEWVAGPFLSVEDGPRGSHVIVIEGEAGPLLVTGGNPSEIRAWDLELLAPVSGPAEDQGGIHKALTGAVLDGQPVVISGSSDETIYVWDPVSGTALSGPWEGQEDWVTSLAVGEMVGGRPVAVSGSHTDSAIWVWDLASGDPVGDPIEAPDSVGALAVAELDGDPVVLAGLDDGTIRVFLLAFQQ